MGDLETIEVTANELPLCRDLCNALMQFQAQQSHKHTHILAAMNFENRLKPSFDNSPHKKLLLVKDQGRPIAYAFANTYYMEESGRYFVPEWLAAIYIKDQLVFYPASQKFPAIIGVFNNIYVRPEYRRKGLALALAKPIMQWLKNSDADDFYVYVSNGNEARAVPFYQQLGFAYSHKVLDGFITAFHQPNKEL